MNTKRVYIPMIDTPPGLRATVLARISRASLLRSRIRMCGLFLCAMASALVLVPAVEYAASEFAASGFVTYLGLLFSDPSTASLFWQPLLFALFESLPSLAVILVGGTFVAFAWSLVRTVREMPHAFLSLSRFA